MTKKQKYHPFKGIALEDRTWPNKQLTKAPRWCSVDLRDGNQALINPLTLEQKLRLFDHLVQIGFKEIEVGFPAAADIEYQFVRTLIEENRIPEDVTIQVLTQARKEQINQTLTCVKGAKQVIVHLYNATSTAQRKMVFKTDIQGITSIATQGIVWIKDAIKAQGIAENSILLEYSPESFTGTEPELALAVCSAVIKAWGGKDPIIINLPATVELCMPNQYADLIEWMHRHLPEKDRLVISLHTHNDRGTGLAASELGLLAGASRVEGTLFGNGERTGNVDLVTMALNLYTQGIDPKLDIYNIDELSDLMENLTEIPTHARHPYAGELVFTAFSGSHQDAINKGFSYYKEHPKEYWDVPYLPIDPNDIGRSYKAMIRINSQSGKGGIAYILDHLYGCQLPKDMHPEFSAYVQAFSEKTKKEVSANQLWNLFEQHYLSLKTPLEFINYRAKKEDDSNSDIDMILELNDKNQSLSLEGLGNGPIDAAKHALEKHIGPFKIEHFVSHSREKGSGSEAVSYMKLKFKNKSHYGVGIDTNTNNSAIKALICALNHLLSDSL